MVFLARSVPTARHCVHRAVACALQQPQRRMDLGTSRHSSSLSCGLVGLPNIGKSTMFNALTNMSVPAENYPFCTIDPHVGMVEVQDPRLDKLQQLSQSKRTVPAAMQFVDIAGLVRGASAGAGMGNSFLHNIREVDAILHLVRCFDSPDVVRGDGDISNGMINPADDAAVIEMELQLADLATVEKASGKKKRWDADTIAAHEKVLAGLQAGVSVRHLGLTAAESELAVKPYNLLSAKPVLFLANLGLGDDPTENLHVAALEDYVAQLGGSDAISTVCAVLEDELGQIECPDERVEFVPSAGPTYHRACLGLSLYLSPTRARCSAVLSSFFAFKPN